MKFHIYRADVTQVASNVRYPHEVEVDSPETLAEAVAFDTVCAAFKNSRRSTGNFIKGDSIMMDVDNDHTENPDEWITPEKVSEMMPDVAFAAVPSRNHMKVKKGKAARPKHHYFFQIVESQDAKAVTELKHAIHAAYPFFDKAALDAAHFAFGAECDPSDVFWQDGWITIDEMVETAETVGAAETSETAETAESTEAPKNDNSETTIPKGQRNKYLSRFAGRILKRYGECESAVELFMKQAGKCEDPLSKQELQTIWSSALKFYREKIVTSKDYIAPGDYNKTPGYLKPEDYSDIGQAKVFAREYADELIYTPGTDFLSYDGKVWNASKQQAVGAIEEFLDLQLEDAMRLCAETKQAFLDAGGDESAFDTGKKKAPDGLTEELLKLLEEYKAARGYYFFVMERRNMKYVLAALRAAKPMLEIKIEDLDANPYLLNTEAGTLDLRDGVSSLRPHDPMDYITKITKCSPSEEGMDLWKEQLEKTFQGDTELINYAQMSLGEDIFGVVESEKLTVAYGGGRNGKSTLFNSICDVLGTYAGVVSADVLTSNCKRNPKPEIAELKGKRFLVAGELEEGVRLSTSILKQICSTDKIKGERKYCDPMEFFPTHSVILFTNVLPKVSSTDDGTWRRLLLIPFRAKFEGKSERKNFTRYLVDHAGGAILAWLIEGARMAYEKDFLVDPPEEVKAAVDKYRADSDWFSHFVDECCEV